MKESFACYCAGAIGLLSMMVIDNDLHKILLLTPVTLCFVAGLICSAIEESKK